MNEKIVLVAAAAYNWAECHRMAGIAKEFLKLGYKVYSLGSGKYDYLLKDGMNHLSIAKDDLWYTKERIHKLMHMDDFGNDYCTQQELEEMIEVEQKLLRKIKPAIVVTGYRTTLSLTCRIEKIPLVWVLSAVISPLYYQHGLATMPERSPVQFVNHIEDKRLQSKYFCTLALINNGTSKVWNKVAKKKGLKPWKSDLNIYMGDFNLMSDIPEFFGELTELPEQFQFCGPLFNQEEIVLPDCVKNYDFNTSRLKIFITMGSSGEKDIIIRILDGLKMIDGDFFIATTSILDEEDQKDCPENFYFAEKFPHRRVAEAVDLSIIHGGQGTLYTALLSGKPFIGIPMFSEQQYNIENIVKYHSGEHVSVLELCDGGLNEIIYKIIHEKQYYENAKKVSDIVGAYYEEPEKEASYVAVQKLLEYFKDE